MENMIITSDVHTVISELAAKLHIPETDVVRQAVYDYEEKIRNKKQSMPYANITDETEPDDFLQIISDSSMNKDDFWTALTAFRRNTAEEGIEITDSDFERWN
ncbi:MAG: hypothetical protein GY749_17095 [Desulfobacteraceae bacterium]|nr:hypothetical protein [Desulfobacteraceae bacterium]